MRHYHIRHQIVFCQYNPNKPHKYGLPWKSLNDVRFPYTYKGVSYAAKAISGNGPFYINATIDYVMYLVTQTKNQVNLKEQNISTDCLYTSIEAANLLLEQNVTTVGALQKGRVGSSRPDVFC